MSGVGVIATSPVCSLGLKEIFECAGLRVGDVCNELPVAVPDDADVLMVELEALRPLSPDAVRYITEASKRMTVVIITNDPWYLSPNVDLAQAAMASAHEKEPELMVSQPDLAVVGARSSGGADGSAGSAEGDGHPSLSARENQVLLHLSSGLTHYQIARKLQISRHTVDTYVRRIRAKLADASQSELTRVTVLRQVR